MLKTSSPPAGVILPVFGAELFSAIKFDIRSKTELVETATTRTPRTPARTPRTGIRSFLIFALFEIKPILQKCSTCVCFNWTWSFRYIFLAQNFIFTKNVSTISSLSMSLLLAGVGCYDVLYGSFLKRKLFFQFEWKKIDFGNYFNVYRCLPSKAPATTACLKRIIRKKCLWCKKLRHKIQGLRLDLVAKNRSNCKFLNNIFFLFRAGVPNLFLLTYPQPEKWKLKYLLLSYGKAFMRFSIQNHTVKLKTNEILVYSLRFLSYSYPRLGTSGLQGQLCRFPYL